MRTQLNDALKSAMKAHDQRRVSTLRMMLAAIKDRDIAARTAESREGVSDEDILQLLAKMIRQRQESAGIYDTNARPELAAQEREEIVIIESFMPRQLSLEDVRAISMKIVAELGAASVKDMGKCMSLLKERYAGQMDFAQASAIVKELLTKS